MFKWILVAIIYANGETLAPMNTVVVDNLMRQADCQKVGNDVRRLHRQWAKIEFTCTAVYRYPDQ